MLGYIPYVTYVNIYKYINNQQNCDIYIYCIQSNIAGNVMIKPSCLPTKWNNQRWETPQKKKKTHQNKDWDFEVKVLTQENADTSNGIGKQQRYGVWARQVVTKPDQKIGIYHHVAIEITNLPLIKHEYFPVKNKTSIHGNFPSTTVDHFRDIFDARVTSMWLNTTSPMTRNFSLCWKKEPSTFPSKQHQYMM